MTEVVSRPAAGRDARPDDEDWPRHGLLLVAVVASVAVQGMAPPGGAAEVVVAALLGTSLVLAFRLARVASALLWLATAVAAAGVAVAVVRALTAAFGDGEARIMNVLVVALAPPAVVLGLVRSLRASRSVQVQAVMGVLSLYMLIGMLFALVFGSIDRLGGAPFFADGTPATVARCLYYSFTTLTTVGYGDLAARTDVGHTLSVFEALTGQIYLVTVVALIVANLGRRQPG